MVRHFCYATESVIGLLATFIIGFFPSVIFFCGSFPLLLSGNVPLFILCLIGGGLSGFLASYVARLASRVVDRKGLVPFDDFDSLEVDAVEDGERQSELFRIEEVSSAPQPVPLALALAREIPPLRTSFRGALALWWLAHFGMAVFAGHASATIVSARLDHPSQTTVLVVGLALHLAFLFAANLYLLLAVAVVEPDEVMWHRVWSYRVPIDLTLALCSTIVPELLK